MSSGSVSGGDNHVDNRDRYVVSARRWVIKIGSALLTDGGRGLDRRAIADWVEQMASMLNQGIGIVLVSSGAVAEGMSRLGWRRRPELIHELQAAAAVGQAGLVQAYETQFQKYQLHTAQVLLDHDDISNRERYLNARSTLQSLIGLGVVPVVNENDTVVTDEIRFGDNDTLAAMVANLIDADLLLILTDQDGLYSADPRENASAELLSEGKAGDVLLQQMAGGSGGGLGRGGMLTKIKAAKLAARSGTSTVIAGGSNEGILLKLAAGENFGTLLIAEQQPMNARKQWLAGRLQVKGCLLLDDGAVEVLSKQGKSLLPVGVRHVQGVFSRGELVSCVDAKGNEIARGLVNYSSLESEKIAGQSSSQISEILGYCDDQELIHRDNLVLV